jgi:hypothetical protein
MIEMDAQLNQFVNRSTETFQRNSNTQRFGEKAANLFLKKLVWHIFLWTKTCSKFTKIKRRLRLKSKKLEWSSLMITKRTIRQRRRNDMCVLN